MQAISSQVVGLNTLYILKATMITGIAWPQREDPCIRHRAALAVANGSIDCGKRNQFQPQIPGSECHLKWQARTALKSLTVFSGHELRIACCTNSIFAGRNIVELKSAVGIRECRERLPGIDVQKEVDDCTRHRQSGR